jgi:CDP-glucose 4,6-dehydratase
MPTESMPCDADVSSAFRGTSVFVTGHTGFKGSWLSLWLHRLGARVTGYALPPHTTPSNFVASGVRELLAGHHEADLRDAARLQAALRDARPDFVFHLAAQPLVRESYRVPVESWDVNVLGTARLLDTIRSLGRPCAVVVVTSDKCYENDGRGRGYAETDPLGGHDPYSASKGACELLVSSFRRSFFPPERVKDHGIRVASARAGNVIGGGDWAPDRIVTDLVGHLAKGLPVPVRNPSAVRPWQHVLEPLSAYLLLAARMAADPDPRWCSAWNFGPRAGDAVTVRELVTRFCEAWGGGRWEDRSDPKAPHEAATLTLNIDKAARDLGWEPRWPLESAVARTAAWYRAFQDGRRPPRDLCLEDVAAYEGR